MIAKWFAGVALLGLLISALSVDDRPLMVIQIPFPFVVSGKQLPAGAYTFSRVVRPVGRGVAQNVLVVRSVDGRYYDTSLVRPLPAPQEQTLGQLDFGRRGGQYFLRYLQSARHGLVLQLPSSPQELEFQKRGVEREAEVVLPGDLDVLSKRINP